MAGDTKHGCLRGVFICALRHFCGFGKNSGQPPPKSKEGFPLDFVKVWFNPERRNGRNSVQCLGLTLWSSHSFLLSTWLKVRRGEEIERNMTWRCQGPSEDVRPYLWPCQINKTVVVKLAVRSKNLAAVATTPCCFSVGRSPFWPLTGHFMAGTIGAAGLSWKTELPIKVNLCCTRQIHLYQSPT